MNIEKSWIQALSRGLALTVWSVSTLACHPPRTESSSSAVSALSGVTTAAGLNPSTPSLGTAFGNWGADEVPVLIMLGQSNTDGRAAYSMRRGGSPEEGLRLAYPSAGNTPCAVHGTDSIPSCDGLDLRSIYVNGGKIGSGLGRPDLEFTYPFERALLGKILKAQEDWNGIGIGKKDSRVQIYVSHFSPTRADGRYVSNAASDTLDSNSESAFQATDSKTRGKWEAIQPLSAQLGAEPGHLKNAVIGSGAWNGNEIFGPEVALALKWRAHVRDKPLYIVKFAVGGSSLSANGVDFKNWSTEANNLWDPGRKLIKEAISAIIRSGKKPRLLGIYWGQGESDCNDAMAKVYGQKLKAFMSRARIGLGVPDANFFIQELYDEQSPGRILVRESQSSVCLADAHCFRLSLDDLRKNQKNWLKYPKGEEKVHFTAHGQSIIGARLYTALKFAVANASPITAP